MQGMVVVWYLNLSKTIQGRSYNPCGVVTLDYADGGILTLGILVLCWKSHLVIMLYAAMQECYVLFVAFGFRFGSVFHLLVQQLNYFTMWFHDTMEPGGCLLLHVCILPPFLHLPENAQTNQ